MKWKWKVTWTFVQVSLPVRGAWIEMTGSVDCAPAESSRPVRGAWIEITVSTASVNVALSLPVRGAWIEIQCSRQTTLSVDVAPRKGSVD